MVVLIKARNFPTNPMAMASSSEEQKHEQPQSPPSPPPPGPAAAAKELVHKTKLIQFLGRTTPIVLQNDNGPCPLLAICNLFFLSLFLDFARVSVYYRFRFAFGSFRFGLCADWKWRRVRNWNFLDF